VLRSAHAFGVPVRASGIVPEPGPEEIKLVEALYADPLIAAALEARDVPRVPPGGPIWQRFPDPVPLTTPLVKDLYWGCGAALTHIELLTGQPAMTVRGFMRRAGIPLRHPGGRAPFLRRWRAGLKAAWEPSRTSPHTPADRTGAPDVAGLWAVPADLGWRGPVFDTMRPLAAQLGLPVETEPVFGEEEYAARPRHGMARIVELADADGTSVVCAPGAVIRHLLVLLAEGASLDVREYPAVKGSVRALFFSGGQLAAADYLPGCASSSRARMWRRAVSRPASSVSRRVASVSEAARSSAAARSAACIRSVPSA
jgi:hypothetical protein